MSLLVILQKERKSHILKIPTVCRMLLCTPRLQPNAYTSTVGVDIISPVFTYSKAEALEG